MCICKMSLPSSKGLVVPLSRSIFCTIKYCPTSIQNRVIPMFQVLLLVSICSTFGSLHLKKLFGDLILSCYNTPEFHWNNLHHPSIWPHMFMCSYLRVWLSKSMRRNGPYPSVSELEIIIPSSFTAGPGGTTRFIVFDLLNTQEVHRNWIKLVF